MTAWQSGLRHHQCPYPHWRVSCFRLVLFLQPAYHRESMLVLVQQISLYGVCGAVSISKKQTNNSMLLNMHFQEERNVFPPIFCNNFPARNSRAMQFHPTSLKCQTAGHTFSKTQNSPSSRENTVTQCSTSVISFFKTVRNKIQLLFSKRIK